jgi:hypothetical protein
MNGECDGSCLVNRDTNQEVKCEDGELLTFYYCEHERCWHLVTLAPAEQEKS